MNVSRNQVPVVAAFALGCLLGGIAGFIWHAPGQPTTWADIRDWLTAAAVIIGVPVALYQLSLQRRQLASQQSVLVSEVGRNIRRDELLDGQIRELQQRARTAQRQQAEMVALELVETIPTDEDPATWMANVTNGSGRPIRNVVCRLKPNYDQDAQLAKSIGLLADWELGGRVARRIMVKPVETPNRSAPLIRASLTYAFAFTCERANFPDARVAARFTDDAGLHWQLDHDLHLESIASRDDW